MGTERHTSKKPEVQTPSGRIESLLNVPTNLQELTVELRRLNDNYDSCEKKLPEVLDEVRRLIDVLEDLREMTAPWLGFRVVEDKSEKAR